MLDALVQAGEEEEEQEEEEEDGKVTVSSWVGEAL